MTGARNQKPEAREEERPGGRPSLELRPIARSEDRAGGNKNTSTRAQQTAADPAHSVWVAASAGTGKTKVLTDRVLRLLLQGTPPGRILCITYTNAAAAEMQNRIQQRLRAWIGLEDTALHAALHDLTQATVSEAMVLRARRLFAEVLDAPEGVRIQTIHGFCQSLLRRFPLEAGVSPHFEVVDEATAMELLAEAKQRLFSYSLQHESWLHQAIQHLAGRLAENQFQSLLKQLIAHRRHIMPALAQPSGVIRLITMAYSALDVPIEQTRETILAAHFACSEGDKAAMRAAVRLLRDGSQDDQQKAEQIIAWWQEPELAQWERYAFVWLTQQGSPRKKLAGKTVLQDEAVASTLADEQARVLACAEAMRALDVAKYTESAINVIDGLLGIYQHLKTTQHVLDYDDLILLSLRLLQRPGIAPWVLFKLDGGLDHLLVDEAQDTSPEQWELIEALTSEFYSGKTSDPRTVFVVGDEKQSIYSFQGAEPRAFMQKKRQFARAAAQVQQAFNEVALGLSFRSTEAVLEAVDAVFAQSGLREGLTEAAADVQHSAHRSGHAGRVELWPLVETEKPEKADVWEVKTTTDAAADGRQILAEQIANKIAQWIDDKEILESQGRPINAGDVLVLLRKRGSFMTHLVRALKRRNVPVAGVDRMIVTEHIAVMDLLALAEFLLLPEDDLNLATVLKSPLCGLNEEALFELAYNRGKASLWQQLSAAKERYPDAYYFLSNLLNKSDYIRPYELFADVLEAGGGRQKFAARLGEEVFDPLEEFLALALQYEQGHTPSLHGFLQWLHGSDMQVKRDMEQGGGAVRIMTVHGAKGLQAPIVFLPDTTDVSPFRNRPFFGEYAGLPLMLWSPSAKEDAVFTADLREAGAREELQESKRLLYVAMTRAEDRLYIGGWKRPDRTLSESSWYHWMAEGIKPIAEVQDEDLVVETPQTADVQAKASIEEKAEWAAMPEYLRTAPAPDPFPPAPLVPSHLHGEVAATEGHSVSSVQDTARFKRGNIVHRLLQYLPDVPAGEREKTAAAYLAHFAKEYDAQAQAVLVQEVLAVLRDPQMAPVFAGNSLAEVPVTGLLGADTVLSGQIDRLAVTEDAVWIIDYKTGQVAETVGEVPEAYIKQMAAYRAALRAIYPEKSMHCALVWTAGPKCTLLPDDVLDSV